MMKGFKPVEPIHFIRRISGADEVVAHWYLENRDGVIDGIA